MTSAAQLIEAVERLHLLSASQIEELNRRPSAHGQANALAAELVERGWITPLQANRLLQGRGDELLLGSHVLLEKLGEGGMGTVFRARNWKLDRPCAVKLIRKERLGSADAVKRFYREIRAAAQLDHVNVVRAYDADEVNGTHYFAMEFVEGIDLAKLVREHGPPPPSLACEYIRQAALGLQHAHERGLVHRDIKPANLLLARAKGAGTIKVLDMGLARQDETVASELSDTLTQVGMVMGTPDYMAPEQSVSSHTVDGRADLYSLGCSLYFLLTGSVPFPGGSLTEKLLKHQMEQPTPLEMLRPDVPAAVADIVYKLMAKKPAERFQTAAELAVELTTLLSEARLWQTTSATKPLKALPVNDESLPTNPFWAGIVAEAKEQTVEHRRKLSARNWYIGIALVLVAWIAFNGFRGSRQPTTTAKGPTSAKKNADRDRNPQPGVPDDSSRHFFNGKDLTGWNHNANVWRVDERGQFIGVNTTNTPQQLLTQGRFTDFEWSFEISYPEDRAQVTTIRFRSAVDRVQGKDRETKNLDNLSLTFRFNNGIQLIGSAAPPTQRLARIWKGAAFNSIKIKVVSNLVSVDVNGETLVENAAFDIPPDGVVGWSLSGGTSVIIRNIRFIDLSRNAVDAQFFNGKDLNGWKASHRGSWQVKDGELIGVCAPSQTAVERLWSEHLYCDFRLSFRFSGRTKTDAAAKHGYRGAAVWFRSRPAAVNGWQGPRCNLGPLPPQWGTLNFVGEGEKNRGLAGIPAAEGEYNDVTITCIGKKVTILFNGKVTVNEEIDMPEDGHICWHCGQSMESVSVRDIHFTDLTGTSATKP